MEVINLLMIIDTLTVEMILSPRSKRKTIDLMEREGVEVFLEAPAPTRLYRTFDLRGTAQEVQKALLILLSDIAPEGRAEASLEAYLAPGTKPGFILSSELPHPQIRKLKRCKICLDDIEDDVVAAEAITRYVVRNHRNGV